MNYRWKRFTNNKEMGYNTAVQLHTTTSTGSYGVTEKHFHHNFLIIQNLTSLLSPDCRYRHQLFATVELISLLHPVWTMEGGERSIIALSLFIIWFIFYCADRVVLLYCSIIFSFCFSFTHSTVLYYIVLYCARQGWH